MFGFFFFGGGVRVGGVGRVGGRGSVVGGGQGGCERRIEVFGKIHKTKSGGGVASGGGFRWGWAWSGVRVDVNAMLGVGGDVGYGRCEPRIEDIVQCTKRYCTILRKLNKCGCGEGEGQSLNLMYLKKIKKEK